MEWINKLESPADFEAALPLTLPQLSPGNYQKAMSTLMPQLDGALEAALIEGLTWFAFTIAEGHGAPFTVVEGRFAPFTVALNECAIHRTTNAQPP